MATRAVTIYASRSAYVERANPNKSDTTRTEISQGNNCNGFEKFIPPSDIIGKRLVDATLYIHAQKSLDPIGSGLIASIGGADVCGVTGLWDPNKTTWNNHPEVYRKGQVTQYGFEMKNLGSAYAWQQIPVEFDSKVPVMAKIAAFGIIFGNWFVYHTSNSQYKPYITITVQDDGGLKPSPARPINGTFINNTRDCELEWNFSVVRGTIEPVTQTKAVISWTYGNTTKTATVNGAAQSYTIPASQLPETGTVTWRVTTTDSAGNTYTSEDATFTTTDATLYACPATPINEYIDGSKTVDLEWGWSISTGTRPTRADFQVSDDGGVTWDNLGTVTNQNDLAYHAAPNELPAGSILWRVRGYNTNSEAGPWSTAAAVVVRRAPNTPVISGVTVTPKPTVTWQAEGQQAYQLQISTWDSGTIFGTDKTDQCPEFLPDGPTIVRLRVQNTFGMWSQWAETTVTIANIPREAIITRTRTTKEDIRLTWETKGEYPEYIIYRDREPIGVTAGKEYTDHTAIGKAAYTVRGVNYDSTYTDSPPVTEILRLQSGVIAIEGDWNWLPLKCLRGRYPQIETSYEADITYTQFSGRRLLVAEISGHYAKQHTLEFTLRSREEKSYWRLWWVNW